MRPHKLKAVSGDVNDDDFDECPESTARIQAAH
jgi:hypothetical protein